MFRKSMLLKMISIMTAFFVLECSRTCHADELVAVAKKPTQLVKNFDERALVVGDKAFLILPDESIHTSASSSQKHYNLFRYRDGQEPAPVLTRADAMRYLGGVPVYDTVSGRLATLSREFDREKSRDATSIVIIDPSTFPAKVDVVSSNGRVNATPCFSPDGQWLAFFSSRGDAHYAQHNSTTGGVTLRVVNVVTRAERELSSPSLQMIPTGIPAWSPDSERIAFVTPFSAREYHVHTVKIDGSDFKTLAKRSRYSADSVIWPFAENLLVTQHGLPGIFKLSLLSDDISIYKTGDYIGTISYSGDGKHIQFPLLNRATGLTTRINVDRIGLDVQAMQ